MIRYIRVVRRSRWDAEEKPAWVGDTEIPADPLADLCTQENKLSLWEIHDETQLRRCVTAVAATRDHLAHVDCLLFPLDLCVSLAIPIEMSAGKTPDEEVNSWHRDAEQLTAGKVVRLGRLLWESGERRRFLPQEVREELRASVRRGSIREASLSERIRAKI